MAITKKDIQAAVENYLPKTANFSMDSTSGEKDRAQIYGRLQAISLASLLTDAEAPFYLTYLASKELLAKIDASISLLQTLQGTEQLKAVTPTAPPRITDLGDLKNAQVALLQLQGALSRGKFDVTYYNNLLSALTSFINTQLKPQVTARNKVAVDAGIRATMQALATTWEDVLTIKNQVRDVLGEYLTSGLESLAASAITSSLSSQVTGFVEKLTSATTAEQGLTAEKNLLSLAAGASALKVVGNAPSITGTAVVPVSHDGSTPSAYSDIQGTATTEPLKPVLSGTAGYPYVNALLVSTGSSGDDLDGDTTTPIFADGDVDFLSAGIEANQILTLIDTGRSYRILAVEDATTLTVSPELPVSLPSVRYFIGQEVPGSLFRDDTRAFTTAFEGGSTGSTEVVSGTSGGFVQSTKASGSDGTNLKTSGSAGQTRARKASGTAGTQTSGSPTFTDNGASLLSALVTTGDVLVITSGANAGSSPYSVLAVNSQTTLNIGVNFGATVATSAWYIEDTSASSEFQDTSATFLTAGVAAGDTLTLTSGTYAGSYTVASVVSQTRLLVTGTPFSTSTTGIAWQIRKVSNRFSTPTATFQSANVLVGDSIHISEGSYDQVLMVSSVVSQTELVLTTAIPQALLSADYQVYTFGSDSVRFQQSDGVDFVDEGIAGTVGGQPATLRTGGVDYQVLARDVSSPADTLLTGTSGLIGAPDDWSIRAGDTTFSFLDTTNAPFSEYEAGDLLILYPGTEQEQRVTISTIVSNSSVETLEPLPQGLADVSYSISALVQPGMYLLVAGRRVKITEVVDAHTLRVDPPLPDAVGVGVSYQVILPATALLTARLTDVALVNGFSSEWVGATVDVMARRPFSGAITAVSDPNNDGINEAIDVSFQIPVGNREVSYRVSKKVEGKSFSLNTSQDVSDLLPGDLVTVWGLDGTFAVSSTQAGGIALQQSLDSGLEDLVFVAVRGGAEGYGRHLLLLSLLGNVAVSQDTSNLRLRVAEVLIDHGTEIQPLLANAAGAVVEDGDSDDKSGIFEDAAVNFTAASVQFGDRLVVFFSDATKATAYVTETLSDTQLRVDPELPQKEVASWTLGRSSVSYALLEAETLRLQMVALKEIVAAYKVPVNNAVLRLLSALRDQGQDRSVDLLTRGKFATYMKTDANSGSYVAAARSALQSSSAYVSEEDAASGSDTILVPPVSLQMLSEGTEAFTGDDQVLSSTQVSLEELRNLSIYLLTGELASGTVVDQENPTLPWLEKTGSLKDRVAWRAQKITSAIQYMLDHPDEFKDEGDE